MFQNLTLSQYISQTWSGGYGPRSVIGELDDIITEREDAFIVRPSTIFPERALSRQKFVLIDYIDFDRILWDLYNHNPTNRIVNGDPAIRIVDKQLPAGPIRNDDSRPTVTVRTSNFDYVYYHETNLQHGEMDQNAIQFIFERIQNADMPEDSESNPFEDEFRDNVNWAPPPSLPNNPP